jgi:hypothetical protein
MSNFNNWHAAKTYFLEDAKETKKTIIFVLYSAKHIYKKTRWQLNKILKRPSGTSLK